MKYKVIGVLDGSDLVEYKKEIRKSSTKVGKTKRPSIIKYMEDFKIESSKGPYGDLINNINNGYKKNQIIAIKNLEKSIEDLSRDCEYYDEDKRSYLSQMSDIKELFGKNIEKNFLLSKNIGAQIEKILKIKNIEKIDLFENRHLFIYTKQLKFKNNVIVGCFKISINLISNTIQIFNLTKRYLYNENNGSHHPNTGIEGFSCFGNISNNIVDALKNRNLYLLTILILQYLRSYNPLDKIFTIADWKNKNKTISYNAEIHEPIDHQYIKKYEIYNY